MITSGYASRIPIVPLSSQQKEHLARLAKQGFANRATNGENVDLIVAIDSVVTRHLNLPHTDQKAINRFCASLLRST
jgi:hypothetical protein